MTKPRIEPLAEPSPEAAETLSKLGGAGGRPLNIFATLAHHPYLLRRFVAFGDVFLGRGLLPARERELVILRTAWRTRSAYEFGHHTRLGRRAGLSDAEIALIARSERGGWGAGDEALLALVDDLDEQDRVTDATWEGLARHWAEPELLELLALAGYYRMTAGILNSAEVEPDPDLPGWPAEGGG